MEEEQTYKDLYNEFIISYKKGSIAGEDVGEVIARLAQHYCQKNTALGNVEIDLNRVSAEEVQKTDDQTGKPISVSKADVLIKSTIEYAKYLQIKTDLQNIEQFINALKYLQKGLLNEYSHVGGM